MKKENFEHIIRAASEITNCNNFIVIGSQSLLGWYDTIPDEVSKSQEIDLYVSNLNFFINPK